MRSRDAFQSSSCIALCVLIKRQKRKEQGRCCLRHTRESESNTGTLPGNIPFPAAGVTQEKNTVFINGTRPVRALSADCLVCGRHLTSERRRRLLRDHGQMSGWNVCEGCNLTLGFRLKPVAFLKPGHEGQTRRTDVPCPCLRLSSLPQRLDFVCAAITLAGDANVFPLRYISII